MIDRRRGWSVLLRSIALDAVSGPIATQDSLFLVRKSFIVLKGIDFAAQPAE
jgi:hypothetical protein